MSSANPAESDWLPFFPKKEKSVPGEKLLVTLPSSSFFFAILIVGLVLHISQPPMDLNLSESHSAHSPREPREPSPPQILTPRGTKVEDTSEEKVEKAKLKLKSGKWLYTGLVTKKWDEKPPDNKIFREDNTSVTGKIFCCEKEEGEGEEKRQKGVLLALILLVTDCLI